MFKKIYIHYQEYEIIQPCNSGHTNDTILISCIYANSNCSSLFYIEKLTSAELFPE